MKRFPGLMTSLSPSWATPQWLYNALNEEFKFDFDPCPLNGIPEQDGLVIEWGKINFVNPPYGRVLPLWIRKGYEEHLKGKTVVFLIPSRTDTKWWHEYVMKANEIRFIRGRLKFSGAVFNAPFPSCVVVFKAG